MGSLLRKVNKEDTVRYEIGEDDYVVFRADMTKGEANNLYGHAPISDRDFAGNAAFVAHFVDTMIVDWSLVDDDGVKVKFSVDEYLALPAAAGRAIDEVAAEHMRKIMGTEADETVGEVTA